MSGEFAAHVNHRCTENSKVVQRAPFRRCLKIGFHHYINGILFSELKIDVYLAVCGVIASFFSSSKALKTLGRDSAGEYVCAAVIIPTIHKDAETGQPDQPQISKSIL